MWCFRCFAAQPRGLPDQASVPHSAMRNCVDRETLKVRCAK